MAIDITGVDGVNIKDKFANGPLTYLTLTSNGFPNMFIATATVISNYMVVGQVVVERISGCIEHMTKHKISGFDPSPEAERRWWNSPMN